MTRSMGLRTCVSLVIVMAVAWLDESAASAADAVSYWNNSVITVTIGQGRPGTEATDAAAYVHIAIYDAINSIDGRFTPFATRVANVPPGASRDAAAAGAAYTILQALYPSSSFAPLAAQFATAYATALGMIPDGQAKNDGIAVGNAAANGLLASRQNDGFRATVPYVFLPLAPGVYQKTPGPDGTIATYAGPVTPWVKQFKPFAILSPDQFRVGPPPALNTGRWAKDLNEVEDFGAASNLPNQRTPEQEEIGLFWGLANPQLQFSANVRKVAHDQGVDLDINESARMFAQIYVTVADAQTGCWDSKYLYNFWRPITAIQNADIDGNDKTHQDAAWRPQIVTPGHPEYPSAHGCVTGSFAHALAAFFGTKHPPGGITLTGASGHPDRFYESTDDIVREIIDARVYNGVHYRTSVEQGAALGRNVARWVAKYSFRPLGAHGRHLDEERGDDAGGDQPF